MIVASILIAYGGDPFIKGKEDDVDWIRLVPTLRDTTSQSDSTFGESKKGNEKSTFSLLKGFKFFQSIFLIDSIFSILQDFLYHLYLLF